MSDLTNGKYSTIGKGVISKLSNAVADLFFSSAGGAEVFSGRLDLTTKEFTYHRYVNFADLDWKQLGAVDVSDSSDHELSYENISPSPKEFLISYGRKNVAQSYGGGEIVIPIGENKPAFLPLYVYTGSGSYDLISVVSIYHAASLKKIIVSRKTSTYDLRFIGWYR